MDPTPHLLEVQKLGRDLRKRAAQMSDEETQAIVRMYYSTQEQRIRAGNAAIAFEKDGKPHLLIDHIHSQFETLESVCRGLLAAKVRNHPLGAWMTGIKGIGPVIASGFLAHIDFGRATTASKIWAYAGLDPNRTWEKGQKRPWNPELKRLCWLLGESFVKVSGYEDSFYGHTIYRERKALEIRRNEAGEYADAARRELERKNYARDTSTKKALEAGRLSDGHIHSRAKRYAVKMFLCHLWMAHRVIVLGEDESTLQPYGVAHLERHTHVISFRLAA